MNKLPYREQPNTLHFRGYITELPEPRMLYVNGKSCVLRMMVVEDFDENGKTRSALLLNIPDYFDRNSIKELMDKGEKVNCGFTSKVLYTRNMSMYAMLTCCSIVPMRGFRINHKSIQIANRKKARKCVSHKVDKDGYKLPYNY